MRCAGGTSLECSAQGRAGAKNVHRTLAARTSQGQIHVFFLGPIFLGERQKKDGIGPVGVQITFFVCASFC